MKPLSKCESKQLSIKLPFSDYHLNYSGLIPNEDAPDIIANTFLAEVTEEELEKVGKAFLGHRECE